MPVMCNTDISRCPFDVARLTSLCLALLLTLASAVCAQSNDQSHETPPQASETNIQDDHGFDVRQAGKAAVKRKVSFGEPKQPARSRSLEEKFADAYNTTAVLPALSRLLERIDAGGDVEADPGAVRAPEFPQLLFEGIPSERLGMFDRAINRDHAILIREQILETLAREERLAQDGATADVLKVIAFFVDPVVLVCTIFFGIILHEYVKHTRRRNAPGCSSEPVADTPVDSAAQKEDGTVDARNTDSISIPDGSARNMPIVIFLAILAFGFMQLTAAMSLMSSVWGWPWFLAIVVGGVLLWFRLVAVLAVAAFFGAWMGWEWPWYGALAFAFPGLVAGVLAFTVMTASGRARPRRSA